MSSLGGRCPEHDLALGPSGECILCRRALGSKQRAVGTPAMLTIVIGSLLVALGSAAAYRAFERAEPLLRAPPPRPAPITEAPEAAAARPERPQPPRRRVRAPAPPSEAPPSSTPAPSAREEPDRYALLAARRRVRITMYSTSWCGYCRRARAYMDAEGIAYVDHDVDADARAAQRLRSLNPRGSVPTFDIDGETQIGFSPHNLELAIDEAARRRL